MRYFYEIINKQKGDLVNVFIHSVKQVEMHWHNEIEILLVLEGSVHIRLDEELHLLKKNDLILINPNESHNIINTGEENILLAVQIIIENFPPSYTQFKGKVFECKSFLHGKEEQHTFDMVRYYLATIVWEINKRKKGYEFTVGSMIYALVAYLIDNFSYTKIDENKVVNTNRDKVRLQNIVGYINQNIDSKITLKEIAQREQLSVSYLSRFIKEKMGMSFQDYINAIRMDKAISLLLTTDRTITDIAYTSGFPSPKSFYKIFRDVQGCTPTELRQNLTLEDSHSQPYSLVGSSVPNRKYLDVDRSQALEKLFSYLDYESRSIKSVVKNIEKEFLIVNAREEGTPYIRYWNKLTTFSQASDETMYWWWKVSSYSRNLIHDTCFVAAYIVSNVINCLGEVDSLGYWLFADVQEESKMGISPFHGGFGIINKDGLKKPSYFAYYLLGKLGDQIISRGSDYMISKTGDNIQIILCNYTYFDSLFLSGDTSALTHIERYSIYEPKLDKEIQINVTGLMGCYKVTHYTLNRNHGSVFDKWVGMGAPENMTEEEIYYLQGISYPKIDVAYLELSGTFEEKLHIPVHGVSLITLEKQ